MTVQPKFDHFNINVTDLTRSLKFYEDALGLKKCGEIIHPEGAFIINYLGCEGSDFRLELTWLRDHPQPYELGENESHLAMRVADDFEAALKFHKELGVVCFENTEMGIYFIEDPDGYWIEILPPG